jgi:XRE family transcriptional regulator
MTLGDVIKTYRTEHSLSMDEFAKRSGLSKGYISMLEKNRNPKTGKPIIPSILTYQSVAKAMSTSVDILMRTVDKEQLVSLEQSPAPASDDLPDLTPKDEREITRMMDDMKEKLMQEEGLMFDGHPASPESIQSILDAMQIGMEMAKKRNKAKYTPKKYRHED